MKTRTFAGRCSDDQYNKLEKAADQLGWSVSKLLYEIVFGDFFTRLDSNILGSIANIKAQQEIERLMKRDKHD